MFFIEWNGLSPLFNEKKTITDQCLEKPFFKNLKHTNQNQSSKNKVATTKYSSNKVQSQEKAETRVKLKSRLKKNTSQISFPDKNVLESNTDNAHLLQKRKYRPQSAFEIDNNLANRNKYVLIYSQNN